MRFALLGPVSVLAGGQRRTVPRAQTRGVLALLLLHAGRSVSREAVIEAVWGGAPPPTARAQVHNAVRDIRQLVESLDPAAVIVTEPFGYRADIDPDDVDALLLDRRLRLATEAARRGDDHEAVCQLRAGLDLWLGEPLMNVSGAFVEPARSRLVDLRLTAVEDLADLDLRHGRPEVVAADLAPFVHAYPMRERLRVRLMTALHHSGRRSDALRNAREYRALLVDREGLDPGPEIVEAETRIRRADPAASTAAPPGPAVPAQLPAARAGFAAREAELAVLDRAGDDPAHRIVAVVGPGGVGKTALAVHWAYRRRLDFADGQLYVNLHGFGVDAEVDAFEALGRLLRGLGEADATLPAGIDERAARYRSLLSGRRMLIVLDNAANSRQVRPLLPGAGPHLTLITSRRRLDSLAVDEGVTQLALAALAPADAMRLMRAHVDADRADDAVLADIARLSEGLPLALRIVAARLRATSTGEVPAYVAGLADEQRRLAAMSLPDDDTAVRSAFGPSYQALSGAGRRLFRLLGVLPTSGTSVAACAAAFGGPVEATLDELRAFHLVQRTPDGRYQTHDLIRLYARELADGEEAAERRLIDWYLAAADRADAVIRPYRGPLGFEATAPPGVPDLADTADALAWFDREADNLLRAVERAEAVHPAACWPLAAVLFGWLDRHQRRMSWLPVYEAGARAAVAVGDRAAEALMRGSTGIFHCFLKQFDAAVESFGQALAVRREIGSRRQIASVLMNLGNAHVETGRNAAAIGCFTEALATIETEPDTTALQGMLLNNLGWAHREAARHDRALDCYAKAAAIARRIEDPHSISYAEGNLARVHADLGRYDVAVGHWQASARYAREGGDLLLEAGAWEGLGQARMHLGDRDPARRELTRALEAYRAIGHARAADVAETLSSIAA